MLNLFASHKLQLVNIARRSQIRFDDLASALALGARPPAKLIKAFESCAEDLFSGAELQEQSSAAKNTCILESDFDYHLVTPCSRLITKNHMERFGVDLENLPELSLIHI